MEPLKKWPLSWVPPKERRVPWYTYPDSDIETGVVDTPKWKWPKLSLSTGMGLLMRIIGCFRTVTKGLSNKLRNIFARCDRVYPV